MKVNNVATSNFTVTDGRYIEITDSLTSADEIQIEMPSYGGYVESQRIRDGVITQATVREFGIGFSIPPTLDLSNFSGGFDVSGDTKDYANYEGYYKDTGGFLSFGKKLQDSFYFQDYSYVVKANRSIDRYGKIVKNLIHTAGYKLFGAVELRDELDMTIKSDEFLLNSLKIIELHLSSPYGHGNNYTYLERYKNVFSDYNENFETITLENINEHLESTSAEELFVSLKNFSTCN